MSAGALDSRNTGTIPAPAQLAELTASDGTSQDRFGQSVAVSGNTVVVGAPTAQIGSNQYEGAAYVFVKPSTGWSNMSQVAKLTPSDGSANLNFGSSVAISGNTIVVGPNPGGNGVAHVFAMPVGGWKDMTETAKLVTGSNGNSVAISGNVIALGTPVAAAVFVFVKPKNGWVGTSSYAAELTASDRTDGTGFGWSVAIAGNTLVAGAIYAPVGSNPNRGAAYVFVKPASGAPKLLFSPGAAYVF